MIYNGDMNKKLFNKGLKKFKSQAKLARELNVSRQFVNQIVKDKRPVPDEVAERLKVLLSKSIKT